MEQRKNSFFVGLVVTIIIILIFTPFLCSLFDEGTKGNIKTDKKGEKTKEILLVDYSFKSNEDRNVTKRYTFENEGNYRICIYGAKAINGGKGGLQCALHSFKKNDTLLFYFEGRKSGGKGGKKCGFWYRRDGNDGAGMARVIRKNYKDFEIIAGGGGGSSESNKNEGGDAEQNGKGKFGGNGAKNSTFYGKKGDWDAKDGTKYKGGDGGRGENWYNYCGGGGGNGYYGGGGGGYGNDETAGGGGGGSNYCNAAHCEISNINNYEPYSEVKIFSEKKIK